MEICIEPPGPFGFSASGVGDTEAERDTGAVCGGLELSEQCWHGGVRRDGENCDSRIVRR